MSNIIIYSSVGIAVILALILFLPKIILKIKMRRSRQKAAKEAKSELAVWRRLSQLAHGGTAAQEVKEGLLDGELGLIKASFNELKAHLNANFKQSSELPWIISIGEPNSGKSALIDASGQNLLSLQNDQVSKTGAKKSPMIRFWASGAAVVADISGRVFFDAWFDGSSAQWYAIIKELKKAHRKSPLHAIIVNIPADSLMADDEALVRKKAHLIKSELGRLLNGLGMSLPCFVVVNKLDIIGGFREYFGGVSSEVKECELGARFDGYSEEAFDEFWAGFIAKLRSGRNSLMLSNGILKGEKPRLDTTSKIYMFAENINALSVNLEIYLKIIFGDYTHSFGANLALNGLFFTSAKDQGYTLNKHFAGLHNKSIDEAHFAEEMMAKQGFFISGLFKRHIFDRYSTASFTQKELLKRAMPHFIAASVLGVLGLGWILAAVFHGDAIKDALQNSPAYYADIGKAFAKKTIDEAYLVGYDDGTITPSSEPKSTKYLGETAMPYNPLLSREGFYTTALRDMQATWRAPIGFWAASFVRYGSSDMLHTERYKMFEAIRNKLLVLPLARLTEDRLILQKNEPFTLKKREALLSLLSYGEVALDPAQGISKAGRIGAMSAFIFPDTSSIIANSIINQSGDDQKNRSLAYSVVFTPTYVDAVKSGINSLINSWEFTDTYLDTPYKQIRDIVYRGDELVKILGQLRDFSATEHAKKTPGEAAKYWQGLKEAYDDNEIASSVASLQESFSILPLTDTQKKALEAKIGFGMPVNIVMADIAYIAYKELFEEDFRLLNYYDNLKTGKEQDLIGDIIDGDYIANSYEVTKKAIERNFAALQSYNFGNLIPLFANTQPDKQKPPRSGHQLLNQLFKLSYNIQSPSNATPQSLDAFVTQGQKNLAQLDELLNEIKDDKNFGGLDELFKAMLTDTTNKTRADMLAVILSKYPPTALQATNLVAQNAPKNAIFAPSHYLNLSTKPDFSPTAIKSFIAPYWQATSTQADIIELVSATKTHAAMVDYTGAFIKYWGDFGDSLRPNIADFGGFLSYLASIRTNVINAELYEVYRKSAQILAELPETMDAQLIAQKMAAIAQLNAKMAALTPSFSASNDEMIAAWLALPKDPAAAAQRLINDKDFDKTYTQVTPQIPWWSSLFAQGKSLAHSAALGDMRQKLRDNNDQFAKFPLLMSASPADYLSRLELLELKDLMMSFGDEVKLLPQFEGAFAVIESLTVPPKGLEFSLFVLDSDKQAQLVKRRALYPSAVAKFRFFELSIDGQKASRLSTTRPALAPDESPHFITTSASAADLVLDFYLYSNAAHPQSSIKVPGSWAILQMYFERRVINDDKNDRIFYIPLRLVDEKGAEFLYYLGAEFSHKIPSKSEWPSSASWSLFR